MLLTRLVRERKTDKQTETGEKLRITNNLWMETWARDEEPADMGKQAEETATHKERHTDRPARSRRKHTLIIHTR